MDIVDTGVELITVVSNYIIIFLFVYKVPFLDYLSTV